MELSFPVHAGDADRDRTADGSADRDHHADARDSDGVGHADSDADRS